MTVTADTDLAFAGPAALAELVRTGEVKARELVELYLRRIEALNPRLAAFRTTMPEQALAEADAISGSEGALAGVPIAVKDDMPVAGQAMTRGSRSYGPPQERDGEALRRLRAAGAIPIGITNVPELTIFPWTATDANGITRNPWDVTRTPGGSSGGSAAAVAAGMVPAATGSDGGGSIRIPAACCGLVGMKPSRGRVSMQPKREHWLGMSVYGPLARTVRDSALLLDVMQGAVEGDADVLPAPAGSYAEAAERPPERLRIAVSRKIPPGLIARLSVDQRGAWERMGKLLSQLGHEIIERDPSYGLSSRQMAAAGRLLVPARRAEKLRAARAATTARILKLWDDVDVLLTPGLARTALAAEGGYGRGALIAFDRAARFTPWTPIFNVTGQPAVTVPASLGSDGLPLSVQLVGRPGAEDTLYSLAGQIEEAQPWAEHRPAVS
jgi:amidase